MYLLDEILQGTNSVERSIAVRGVVRHLLDAGFRDGTSTGLDLDPRHVARVVAFLSSDDASDVTGRIIHVAGPEIREYATTRTSRSELVDRVVAWTGDDTPRVPTN